MQIPQSVRTPHPYSHTEAHPIAQEGHCLVYSLRYALIAPMPHTLHMHHLVDAPWALWVPESYGRSQSKCTSKQYNPKHIHLQDITRLHCTVTTHGRCTCTPYPAHASPGGCSLSFVGSTRLRQIAEQAHLKAIQSKAHTSARHYKVALHRNHKRQVHLYPKPCTRITWWLLLGLCGPPRGYGRPQSTHLEANTPLPPPSA